LIPGVTSSDSEVEVSSGYRGDTDRVGRLNLRGGATGERREKWPMAREVRIREMSGSAMLGD
jgi:hypothetical protein